MSTSKLLTDLPVEISNQIFNECDFSSVLALRKVCRSTRECIDDMKPRPESRGIEILINKEMLCWRWEGKHEEVLYAEYRKQENGCMMTWNNKWNTEGGKTKLLEGCDFVDTFLREIEVILKFHPSFKNFDLSINTDPLDPKILKLFEKKISPVKVKTLTFEVWNPDIVHRILPYFDANSLHMLKIGNHGVEETELPKSFIDLSEISKLEHWKTAKILDIDSFYVPYKIQDFWHFKEISIAWQKISFEQIFGLLEEMVQAPILRYALVRSPNIEKDERLVQTFGESFKQDEIREKWYFRIPKSEEILEFIISTKGAVLFRRIEKEEMPEGAEITEVTIA